MHFMNPVPVMKLVEVIRGLATADATYQTVLALGKRFGKTLVTAKDIPGFIVNRMLIPILNEACFALQEGLGSAEDIDTGVKLGLNHPMGPFELADLIGLDTCLAIAEVLHARARRRQVPAGPLLRQYVAAGWLGARSAAASTSTSRGNRNGVVRKRSIRSRTGSSPPSRSRAKRRSTRSIARRSTSSAGRCARPTATRACAASS